MIHHLAQTPYVAVMKVLMVGALARRAASSKSLLPPTKPERRPLAGATGFFFAMELVMRSGSE
jgi:hypothetical protein